MKKTQYIILGVLILAGSVLLVTGLNLFNQTHEELQHVQPDIRLAAQDLYAAFEENEHTANELYTGKVLEIEGIISSIDKPSEGITNVLIKAGEDTFVGISCSFTSVNSEHNSILKKGNKVKIRGECTGFLMDVNLVRCVLISL